MQIYVVTSQPLEGGALSRYYFFDKSNAQHQAMLSLNSRRQVSIEERHTQDALPKPARDPSGIEEIAYYDLMKRVRQFIDSYKITDPTQAERLYVHNYATLVKDLCQIVGYAEKPGQAETEKEILAGLREGNDKLLTASEELHHSPFPPEDKMVERARQPGSLLKNAFFGRRETSKTNPPAPTGDDHFPTYVPVSDSERSTPPTSDTSGSSSYSSDSGSSGGDSGGGGGGGGD